MRPERNPLDLNNLPEDYSTRDGKQPSEDSSSCVAGGSGGGGGGGGYRKKKSGGKDECGKVYECRFCSLKFCKSQALGGHMNRHRQERETETLNRARQLVFSNDNLSSTHLGGQPITHGGFHQTPGGNIGDSAALPFRSSIYQPRLFPAAGSTSNILQPPPPPAQPQPYLYASPSSRLVTYPSSQQYPPHSHPAVNEYYVGHVLSSNPNYVGGPQPQQPESNYTCIGAPVGHGFGPGTDMGAIGGGGGGGGGRDGSLQNQRRLDPSPMINRFQDGF